MTEIWYEEVLNGDTPRTLPRVERSSLYDNGCRVGTGQSWHAEGGDWQYIWTEGVVECHVVGLYGNRSAYMAHVRPVDMKDDRNLLLETLPEEVRLGEDLEASIVGSRHSDTEAVLETISTLDEFLPSNETPTQYALTGLQPDEPCGSAVIRLDSGELYRVS